MQSPYPTGSHTRISPLPRLFQAKYGTSVSGAAPASTGGTNNTISGVWPATMPAVLM